VGKGWTEGMEDSGEWEEGDENIREGKWGLLHGLGGGLSPSFKGEWKALAGDKRLVSKELPIGNDLCRVEWSRDR